MKLTKVDNMMLFPIAIWQVDYEDVADMNRAIVEEIQAVDWDADHKRRGLDVLAANRYNEDYFITASQVPSARAVQEAFASNCMEIARRLDWDLDEHELRVTAMWAHVTPPGRSTQVHYHLPDTLSCAYYVKVPEHSGNLKFVDDRKYRASEPKVKRICPPTQTSAVIEAREGRMMIFPSSLSHQVEENRSKETRISLSFNATVYPIGSTG